MKRLLHERYRPIVVGGACLVALPFALRALGLTVDTATLVVVFALAALGLNVLVGFTGLTSLGHSAWFGVGGYAAALAQKHWWPGQMALPVVFSVALIAAVSVVVGFLILRRRGAYFALLTLALSALTYAVAFRWTEVTGGEDGLGGLQRGRLGPVDFSNNAAYYVLVAAIAFAVLCLMQRMLRSPFGHVLVAIRENQQRTSFQGYDVDRYKLAAFVISSAVTALAGALFAFQQYLISADATTVALSGELVAMVLIGGMHQLLGPALGALFYVFFRELFSIWTQNWLFWFGLVFVGFVLFSPSGLVGIWEQVRRRLRPPPEESAAMSGRRVHEGLPVPAFLRGEHEHGTVLEIQDVHKHFGGIQAVAGAALEVQAGGVHALIGPNGAGKTTLFNLVSGMFPPDHGSVRLRGVALHGMAAHGICRRGVARSFQITNLFRGLTIYENLRLSVQACHAGRFNLWRDADDYSEVHAQTRELVSFLGVEGIEEIRGGDLSYGGQRLVDLGIALGSRPRVLMLDEPLAGLAAAERERVSGLVRRISEHVPVLMVEHDIDRVLGLSQRVTVMNQGSVLMTGSPAEVRADSRVQELYTGKGTPVSGRGGREAAERATLLACERLNTFYGKSHILNDAMLEVREGEIVALLGRNGAGKSTFLKSICGLVTASSGMIAFAGRDITRLPAHQIARYGIGYVPQGRGLFAGMTVAENLALGRLARDQQPKDGGVVWSEERVFDLFPRLAERRDVAADYISGGEQQMLAVARALSGNVRLLLLDEPFEGLAPVIVEELFRVFDRLRGEISIVIVEHNLDLVLALADRVFALERGAVFHQGPAEPLLHDLAYRKKILWL